MFTMPLEVPYLEIAANLFTVICIFLAGRNSIHTWSTGIVACILFGILFYGANLYADVTLQAFFIITSVVGWKNWIPQNTSGSTEPPTNATNRYMQISLGAGLIGACVYGYLLHTFTNAYAPFIDSLVLMGSIVAQLLLMRRNIQNWPVWIFVNVLSVPLYFSRGLYVTSALYVVFLINAVWSYYHWRKLMIK